MAKEGRDDKGRFVKGNTHGISTETAREMQKRSSAKQVENHIVADTLRRALLGKDPDTGNPMIVSIVENTLKRTKKGGSMGDLRVAADILGELEQKIDHSGSIELSFKFGE